METEARMIPKQRVEFSTSSHGISLLLSSDRFPCDRRTMNRCGISDTGPLHSGGVHTASITNTQSNYTRALKVN